MGDLPANYRPQDVGRFKAHTPRVPLTDPPSYQALRADEDETYTHQVYEPSGEDFLGPNFTETQASIFAFALNAVADGLILTAVRRLGDRPARSYHGSTEGVRAL